MSSACKGWPSPAPTWRTTMYFRHSGDCDFSSGYKTENRVAAKSLPADDALNYRTGSGSDLAVSVQLTQFESVAAARSLPLPVLM